jgi:hypothetical protein
MGARMPVYFRGGSMACTCDIQTLTTSGCKCGEIEREREMLLKPPAYDQIYAQFKQYHDSIGTDPLAEVKADPAVLFRANGMEPDPAQIELMKCRDRNVLVNWTRQFGGKSQTVAAIALHEAITNLGKKGEGSLTLVFSSTQRESIELLRKIRFLRYGLLRKQGYNQERKWKPRSSKRDVERYAGFLRGEHGWDELDSLPSDLGAVTDAQTSIELENGSRIISLPSRQAIVSYTVDLLILDEAKVIPDELFNSVRPMLATTGGRMIAPSTPLGQRGWFWEQWKKCDEAKRDGVPEPWTRFFRTCWDCPRLDRKWVENERRLIGEFWFRQEYECAFLDPVGAVFRGEDIERALRAGTEQPYEPVEVPW